MKRNMSLSQELDLTRDGTAEMTRWCIIIALHQCFGVGKDRLNKIEARADALAYESLDVAMTANDKGMPSTDRSRALREGWLPEGVEPEFRVPVLRAPRAAGSSSCGWRATWPPAWCGPSTPGPAWSCWGTAASD